MPSLKEQYGSFLKGSLKEKYGQFLDVSEVQPETPQLAGVLPQPEIAPQVGGAGMPPMTGPSLGGQAVAGIIEPIARTLSDNAASMMADIDAIPHDPGPEAGRMVRERLGEGFRMTNFEGRPINVGTSTYGPRDLTPPEQAWMDMPEGYRPSGLAHAVGKYALGIPTFMASLPQTGLDILNPPEGQTGFGRLKEEGAGLGQMMGDLIPQIQYLSQLPGLVTDPEIAAKATLDPSAVGRLYESGGSAPTYAAGMMLGLSGAKGAMKPVIPKVRGRYAESGMRTRVPQLGRMAPEYPRFAPEGLQRKAQPRTEWPERIEPKEAPHAVRPEKPTKPVTLPKESKQKVTAPVSGGIAAQPPVKTPVKTQPVKTPPPKKPVVETAVATPEPKKPIVLTKAESSRVRKAFNLDKLPDAERKPIEESLNQAKRDKHDITAYETAMDVVKNPRPLKDVEQAGISLRVTQLAEQRDVITREISDLTERGDGWAAKKARERAEAIDAQVDVLTAAYDYGGTELGRAMNLRKFGMDRESFKLTPVLQRGREAHGGKLKQKTTQEFERLTSRYSKVEKELIDMRAKHEKMAPEYERLQAEKVTRIENQKATQNKRTTKKRESIYTERDDIKKQLVALGFQVKDVTGLTTEGSYLVGKLAATYIKEGAITLNGVVRRVTSDLPNVNEADVYQSLAARAPKTQAKAMGEAQRRVLRLKKQARLLTQIENAEKGLFQKRGVGKKSSRPEIKALQKQLAELRKSAWASGIESKKLERAMNTLDELQDQLGSHYKDLKKTPLDQGSIESVRTKLKQVRRALRVDEDLASLHKQLDSGDFIIKERPVAKKLPVELERKEIELIRARKDIRAMIRNQQPMTTRQKIGEGFNFLRTMKATSDLSATLRQSLALSARRPGTAIKVFGKSIKAFGSTYKAEQIDRAIRSHPNHYLREKAGLFLAEMEGPRITAREEMFMSNWAHKIPGYGRLVKASDRHMVSHINLMRASAFDQFMDAVPNATTKEMKAWADFVNVASGRGNLNVGKAGEALSALLFAPRFAWSRVEYPGMLIKHWKNPRVRKEIAKDQVAMASLFASTLTLASLAGAEVELSPRSSDFLKVKVGDTRYDLAAGFLQPMRYLLRFPARGLDKYGVTGKHLPESEKKFLPMDDFLRLISYKAAPSVTLTDALIRGKFNFGGGEVTPANVAYRTLSPILAEAIVDAWRDHESAGKIATIALGEGLGLGITSYRRKSKVVDIR